MIRDIFYKIKYELIGSNICDAIGHSYSEAYGYDGKERKICFRCYNEMEQKTDKT
jgi:hypothetical protein